MAKKPPDRGGSKGNPSASSRQKRETTDELKQLNSQLRESEYRYRQLFECNPHPMFVYDLATLRFLAVNNVMLANYGYTHDEFMAMTLRDIHLAEDIPALMENIANVTTGIDRAGIWRHRLKDGQVINVEITSHVLTFEGRTAELVLAHDITEKKIAEREVSRLANRLMTTLESITDAFFTLDHEWCFTYLNSEAEKLLQRKRKDLLYKNVWDEFPEAVDTAFYREYHRAMANHCTVEFEEYYDPLGIWFEVKAYPSEEGLAVYFRDFTERKASQEKLRESEERFRNIARATADAIWDWDIVTGDMWWNEGMKTLFGYAPEDIEPDISSWTNRLHPDEKDRIVNDVNRAIAGESDFWAGEYHFRRRDGTYAIVSDRSFIIRNEQGKAIRMVGGKNDITESRQQQKLLAQQAELLDKAHDAILVKSIDTRILFWNKGAERLDGRRGSRAMRGRITLRQPGGIKASHHRIDGTRRMAR